MPSDCLTKTIHCTIWTLTDVMLTSPSEPKTSEELQRSSRRILDVRSGANKEDIRPQRKKIKSQRKTKPTVRGLRKAENTIY